MIEKFRHAVRSALLRLGLYRDEVDIDFWGSWAILLLGFILLGVLLHLFKRWGI